MLERRSLSGIFLLFAFGYLPTFCDLPRPSRALRPSCINGRPTIPSVGSTTSTTSSVIPRLGLTSTTRPRPYKVGWQSGPMRICVRAPSLRSRTRSGYLEVLLGRIRLRCSDPSLAGQIEISSPSRPSATATVQTKRPTSTPWIAPMLKIRSGERL